MQEFLEMRQLEAPGSDLEALLTVWNELETSSLSQVSCNNLSGLFTTETLDYNTQTDYW